MISFTAIIEPAAVEPEPETWTNFLSTAQDTHCPIRKSRGEKEERHAA